MRTPDLVPQLANALGWAVEDDMRLSIPSEPGAGVTIRGERTHFAISAWRLRFPSGYHDPATPPTIRVSRSRPLGEIVKEIRRRLAPAYGEYLDKARSAIARAESEEEMANRHAAEFHAILPTNYPPYRASSYSEPTVGLALKPGNGYGSFRATHYQGRANVELTSIPHELAVAIARTIADFEAAQ